MSIFAIILKRLSQLAVLLLVVALSTFILSALIPGDFFSTQELDPAVRQQTIDQLRQHRGLDQPLLMQFGNWLQRCARLDLGNSDFYRRPVRNVVYDAAAETMWMGIPAALLGLIGGILLGALHAASRDGIPGLALDLFSAVALALPTLVLGLAALLFAAATQWFPLGGMNAANLENPAFITWLLDRFHHLVLPVACLTLPILAYVERIQCAATGEILEAPHVRAAYARGLSSIQGFFALPAAPLAHSDPVHIGPAVGQHSQRQSRTGGDLCLARPGTGDL